MDIQDKPEIDIQADLNFDMQHRSDLKEQFDYVFCLETLQYVFDPLTAHKNISFFLNSFRGAFNLYLSHKIIHKRR